MEKPPFQFGLKAVFVVTTAIAVCAGCYSNRTSPQVAILITYAFYSFSAVLVATVFGFFCSWLFDCFGIGTKDDSLPP
jgi:hypothetical protein